MRALFSLMFLGAFLYVGWYVYKHLTPEEKQKVVSVGKQGLDKAGEAATKVTKEGLKHIGTTQPSK